MRRNLARVATIVALGALSGLLAASRLSLQRTVQEKALLERRLALLQEDSERMRSALAKVDAARAEQQSREWRTKIERDVELIRGLNFRKPVVYAVVTRQQIKDVVSRKLSEVYSAEEFRNMSAAMARLGLLPAGFDLRAKYVELLGEQIAAFYDQHTHQLFMFADASLEVGQNRVILAHELTHALQDQHFGLLKMPLEIKDNDDRAMAVSALVEGDATLVMSAYMMKSFSLKTLKENVGSAMAQNAEQLASAPRIMREGLLFPYLRGQEFCATISEKGGYAALSGCYQRLPGSTTEILHPARYAQQWKPVEVEWKQAALNGQAPTLTNVLGEVAMRVQLDGGVENQDAVARVANERLAAQWRGDRYWYFAGEDAVVWKTEWQSPEAAEEFEKKEVALGESGAGKREEGAFSVARTGSSVLVLTATTRAAVNGLRDAFGGAKQ